MAKYTFNEKLARERGLSDAELDKLQKIYNKIDEIFEVQRSYISSKIEPEPKLLRAWDKMIRNLEFKLQKLWKFEKNEKYLHYWFEQPFCSCPKMDNYERVGYGNFIINCDCPVHGHICSEVQKSDQATGC